MRIDFSLSDFNRISTAPLDRPILLVYVKQKAKFNGQTGMFITEGIAEMHVKKSYDVETETWTREVLETLDWMDYTGRLLQQNPHIDKPTGNKVIGWMDMPRLPKIIE